jgi:hypothetical protein
MTDADQAMLATGRLRREYFLLHMGFAGDDLTYVRLRREKEDKATWAYDFMAAKDMCGFR